LDHRHDAGRGRRAERALRKDIQADLRQPTFQHHHTGILVGNIEKSAAEMSSRFGYQIESEIIEDPRQTALVQFLRQPGAPSWLELISPNGEASKLTSALKKGGGLHHLCYEVGDMSMSCEHLREQGMLLLSEPVPAVAFPDRRIAWLMDRSGLLIELLDEGSGPLSLRSIRKREDAA
jgi:methylmalonyl-CoA/ethylmalonyl-CoA epimerase